MGACSLDLKTNAFPQREWLMLVLSYQNLSNETWSNQTFPIFYIGGTTAKNYYHLDEILIKNLKWKTICMEISFLLKALRIQRVKLTVKFAVE